MHANLLNTKFFFTFVLKRVKETIQISKHYFSNNIKINCNRKMIVCKETLQKQQQKKSMRTLRFYCNIKKSKSPEHLGILQNAE